MTEHAPFIAAAWGLTVLLLLALFVASLIACLRAEKSLKEEPDK